VFGSLTAIRALQEQGIDHARCVVLIEGCEESGSFRPAALYRRTRRPHRLTEPGRLSGCRVRQLRSVLVYHVLARQSRWHTEGRGIERRCTLRQRERRGAIEFPRAASTAFANRGPAIRQDSHSRIACRNTGSAPEAGRTCCRVLGDSVWRRFPWVDRDSTPGESPLDLLLNNTWRPTLSVTGADGLPALVNAGNVLLPGTTLKLSFRLPPTCDADDAAQAIRRVLEADPPPFAKVQFKAESTMGGWNAPAVAGWLDASIQEASKSHFGKPSMYMGTGGSIPFMGMLGERFPEAQFLVTGLLGPNSNAHGPNEFLHIETGKRLTSCVSHVLRDHFARA
jgi:hypothetical protein